MKKTVLNVIALIVLGLIMQTGGAYLVNAAVDCFAGMEAVNEYTAYMASINAMTPRQYIHILFVAPILEEIVFRLIFLRAGRMVMPFWAANLVQAVLFGVYHTLTIQRVYGFVLGLMIGCVFGYCPVIYKKNPNASGLRDLPDCLLGTGITVILHMVINASGLYITPMFPADLAFSVQLLMGIILMVIAGAVCVLLKYESDGKYLLTDINRGQ